MKPCLKCGCAKTPTNTSIDKRRNDGLCIYCKHCLKKQRNTPEAIKSRKEKQKEYYTKNKNTILINTREYNLKKKFNILEEDYLSILKLQNYSCEICGKNEKEFVRRLAVDHCHSTGKIRGLLCHNCNTGLGKLGDSIESLTKALNYLKESK